MKTKFTQQLKFRKDHKNLSYSEISTKTQIDENRIKEIFEGAMPTIVELTKLAIALEFNLNTLIGFIYFDDLNATIPVTLINKIIEEDRIDELVYCFITNKLILNQGNLYKVNHVYTITNKIPDETTIKIINMLLKHGYGELASSLVNDEIASKLFKKIIELDKYGEKTKNEFLYGSLDRRIDDKKIISVNFPDSSYKILNYLDNDDKAIVLEEIEKRYKRYEEHLKELVKNDVKFFCNNDEYSYLINYTFLAFKLYLEPFKNVIGLEEQIERINNLQKEIINFVKAIAIKK